MPHPDFTTVKTPPNRNSVETEVQLGPGDALPEVIAGDVGFDGASSVAPSWASLVACNQAQEVHPIITNTTNQYFHLVALSVLR